jgi:hypothetical protein
VGLGIGCLGMPVASIVLFSVAESGGDEGWVTLVLGAALCLGAVVWLTRYFNRRGTGGRFLMGLIVGFILPLLLIAGCFALFADGNMFR